MTDMNKYKNVSLQKETYSILEKLSKGITARRQIVYIKNNRSISKQGSEKIKW